MRREILALTEGDVVLLLPSRLGLRSQRQLKSWLSTILHDLEAAERARQRNESIVAIGSVAAR